MKQLTWSDFPNPCYNPQERYGDFEGTILDILKDDRIPASDKVWAATREGILDDKTLRLFACKCVREVWHLLTDKRSKNAVIVAERYAIGKASEEELNAAARAAAYAAANVAANVAAAYAAANVAANVAAAAAASAAAAAYAAAAAADATAYASAAADYAATRAADYAAANIAAARAAAYAAANLAAARDAAREKQVQILINLIEEETK